MSNKEQNRAIINELEVKSILTQLGFKKTDNSGVYTFENAGHITEMDFSDIEGIKEIVLTILQVGNKQGYDRCMEFEVMK